MIDYIKMYESMSASHETKSLRFPLYFNFKLLSIANDFLSKTKRVTKSLIRVRKCLNSKS